jgi:branched-chain amino acid transport system ATP-binding protein
VSSSSEVRADTPRERLRDEHDGDLPDRVPAEVVLELKGMSAGYGKIEVVHGIDLEVAAGEVMAILGPNGAGKSTMMKVVGGALKHSSGEVKISGKELTRPGTDRFAKAGVCWIPEGRGIFPNLTVSENLLMWSYRPGASRREIEGEAFRRFPILAERRDQKAGSLSGGEQQMLALSRAMAGRPRLILIDELSMGLAPKFVETLFEVVVELSRSGIAILLVEQFVHAAVEIATRAALLVQGRISAVGSPEDIAEKAKGAYLTA